MGSVSDEQDDEFYGKEGSKELQGRDSLYEKMGPSQWPSEYYEPEVRHAHANI